MVFNDREKERNGGGTDRYVLYDKKGVTLKMEVTQDGEKLYFSPGPRFFSEGSVRLSLFFPASQCVSLSRRFKANLPLVVIINAENGSLKLQLIVSV